MENTTKTKTKSEAQDKAAAAELFAGVDEKMELDGDEQKELLEFETVNKEGKDIEFDKIQIKDLSVKMEHRRVPVPRHRFAPLK